MDDPLVDPTRPDVPMMDDRYDLPSNRYEMFDGHDGFMHDGGTGWMAALMVIVLLLLVAAIAALVAVLIMRARSGSIGGATPPAAQGTGAVGGIGAPGDAGRLLDDRLVRGEVSPEEYETIRSLLERTT